MRWTRRSAVAVTTAAVLVGGGLALAQGAASRSLPASSSASHDGSVDELLTQVDALEAAVAASSVDGRGRSSDDPATHDLLDDDRWDDDRWDDDRWDDDHRDDDHRDDDHRDDDHRGGDDRDDD